MKVNSGDMIKNMRMNIGVTQEEFASRIYVSQRQLSRIENGKQEVDIWQFMSFMELLGLPTDDFWLMYLETKDYEYYLAYKQIKNLAWEDKISETKELLDKLEKSPMSKHKFIRQFIDIYRIDLDVKMSHEQAIKENVKAMHICRPDFDEAKVSEYLLTYNEISIIIGIAIHAGALGDVERSVALHKAVIDNREKIRASDEDKARFLPILMSNLSTILGRAGRYEESLEYCHKALDASRKYGNFHMIPNILVNMASGYRLTGEEERVYMTYLNRAYQCALAFGSQKNIDIIKKTAEESFGVKDL